MFARWKRALQWISVVESYHKRDFAEFLRNLSTYETTYTLTYYERALKGFSLLMTGDGDTSERHFRELVTDIGTGKTQKARYLSLFSRAMIDRLNGDEAAYEKRRLETLSLKPGHLCKRMLPL